MTFTDSPYEKMMRRCPRTAEALVPAKAPKGSPCAGCPYWRGIACISCYRELLGGQAQPRCAGR